MSHEVTACFNHACVAQEKLLPFLQFMDATFPADDGVHIACNWWLQLLVPSMFLGRVHSQVVVES